MKKLINKISNKCNAVAVSAHTAIMSRKAESYVGEGVKILIAVVIGALLLTLLYTLFNTTIMPTVTSKITDLFTKTPSIT